MNTVVSAAQRITADPIFVPPLNDGEIWRGVVSVGTKLHHVIQLPGDNDDADWDTQMAWAKEQGGDLPSRVEQALLLAEARDQFKSDAYWSNEKHASDSGYAWCQGFDYGSQYYGFINRQLRAVAVRRVPIQ